MNHRTWPWQVLSKLERFLILLSQMDRVTGIYKLNWSQRIRTSWMIINNIHILYILTIIYIHTHADMRSLYVFATRHCFRVPMALPSLGCLEPAHTVFEALTKSLEPARFTKAWICQTYLWSHFVSLSLYIYLYIKITLICSRSYYIMIHYLYEHFCTDVGDHCLPLPLDLFPALQGFHRHQWKPRFGNCRLSVLAIEIYWKVTKEVLHSFALLRTRSGLRSFEWWTWLTRSSAPMQWS